MTSTPRRGGTYNESVLVLLAIQDERASGLDWAEERARALLVLVLVRTDWEGRAGSRNNNQLLVGRDPT